MCMQLLVWLPVILWLTQGFGVPAGRGERVMGRREREWRVTPDMMAGLKKRQEKPMAKFEVVVDKGKWSVCYRPHGRCVHGNIEVGPPSFHMVYPHENLEAV